MSTKKKFVDDLMKKMNKTYGEDDDIGYNQGIRRAVAELYDNLFPYEECGGCLYYAQAKCKKSDMNIEDVRRVVSEGPLCPELSAKDRLFNATFGK